MGDFPAILGGYAMKYRLALGLLATLALVTADTPIRAVDQDLIDKAIEKGVKALRRMQQPDGTWPHQYIGATALAGVTLLECGADKQDKAVIRAADIVRKTSIDLRHTYSISLSLLFLDLLGDPEDEPLIKSLMARLLAGQDATSGGWTYGCPLPSESERQPLRDKLNKRKEAAAGRDGETAAEKRKDGDAVPDPRRRFRPPGAGAPPEAGAPGFPPIPVAAMPDMSGIVGGPGDNSNTQFAALGLWVGRRHGVPVDNALTRLAQRFRSMQMEDGGWAYEQRPMGMPANVPLPPGMGSTPSMTCAGLIALAIADGATLEITRKRKPDAKPPDISNDKNLMRGLEALGVVIGNPRGLKPAGQVRNFGPPGAPVFDPANRVGGRSYYFLWSLERVAMALDLKTIGKKDWYGWGAEILLENQLPDGTWSGEYGPGGVDTCFALLFLKRANLVRDLTANIKGKITDPGERVLRAARGIGKQSGLKMGSGIERKDSKPIDKPLLKSTSPESGQLAEDLLKATGRSRDQMLETMESGKGGKYTEALALAIPQLEGETRKKAREALANRLTRMKDETLEAYLQDEEPEIRRAAAIAAGQKDSKLLVPNLIGMLRDPEIDVVRAAHASLKSLTSQDFGPSATATREERDQATQKWAAWWSKQRKK
jgi:hypothetical protein